MRCSSTSIFIIYIRYLLQGMGTLDRLQYAFLPQSILLQLQQQLWDCMNFWKFGTVLQEEKRREKKRNTDSKDGKRISHRGRRRGSRLKVCVQLPIHQFQTPSFLRLLQLPRGGFLLHFWVWSNWPWFHSPAPMPIPYHSLMWKNSCRQICHSSSSNNSHPGCRWNQSISLEESPLLGRIYKHVGHRALKFLVVKSNPILQRIMNLFWRFANMSERVLSSRLWNETQFFLDLLASWGIANM